MGKKKTQNVEAFLRHSEYFRRFIFPAWMKRNPQAAEELIRQVREDPEAEKEVQYHLERAAKG